MPRRPSKIPLQANFYPRVRVYYLWSTTVYFVIADLQLIDNTAFVVFFCFLGVNITKDIKWDTNTMTLY